MIIKKRTIETWIVSLILILCFIFMIIYGALLKYHYDGGTKFKNLQKIAVFFADVPSNTKKILSKVDDVNKLVSTEKNKNLPRYKRFIESKRDALLILPRYDGNLERSIVEIIDLNNFKVLHTYKHNIKDMNKLIDTSKKENERVKIDGSTIRFLYMHPLLLEDGSLISDSQYAPLFKIDYCSNLLWVNQEDRFHHSIMLDKNGDIWTGSQLFPYSNFVGKKIKDYGFSDDAIAKIDISGNLLFSKSISELLAENGLINKNFFGDSDDPIHLNDIEPALTNGNYWNQGDLFISIRHKSAIIHYRPSTNKVINYIKGPFHMQHDVDIISNKEISIFNNNNSYLKNAKNSEVLIYNFETKSFSKKFHKQVIKENLKTYSEGLSEIFDDGSMLFEEQNHGRLIFFNKDGQKEWEFVNKDSNGKVYPISWSRIIKDKKLLKILRNKIKNTSCLN